MKQEDLEILRKAREKEAKMHTPSFIAEYHNALNNDLCNALLQIAKEKIEADPSLNKSDPKSSSDISFRKDWFIFKSYSLNGIIKKRFMSYYNFFW